jgi:Asp-tRNA(Asn)/Glu-tRNA(Gln) amidotransferase C subunit
LRVSLGKPVLPFRRHALMRVPVPQLPPKPDFAAIEAAAHGSANRRTFIMALIGNLVYSWANNESMFIYVLMVLMNTDEASAAVVFTTLNTTRARLDLVERLARIKIRDKSVQKALERIITQFNELTKLRNEFNHCMYTLNERGEITHTHSIRMQDVKGKLQLGVVRKMDDARINDILAAVRDMTKLNREIWDFLPRLQGSLQASANEPTQKS